MSRQLREHIRKQLKTILESKYGYYKDKDGRVQKGDLATAWKERMKSAVEDTDDQKELSLKNVLKNLKDDSKSDAFKKVIQKKQKEIKEDEITEDDVVKANQDALEAKIVADTLEKEAKEKEEKLKEGPEEEAAKKAELEANTATIAAANKRKEAAKLTQKAADKEITTTKADSATTAKLESKKKLEEYIKEMIPSLLEADEEEELEGEFPEEEGQEDDAFVPNHYKPEFIPREAEQTLERLGLTPIDRYVDFVNFMDSTPKSLKVVLTNGNSFLLYFDETGLLLTIGANEIDLSDDRNLPEAQDMINDLLMGPVDAPEEEGEEEAGAEEEAPAEEEPAAEEEPEEEVPSEA